MSCSSASLAPTMPKPWPSFTPIAGAVVGRPEPTGLYLWVLEQNVDAQAFYEARGGACVGRRLVDAPGGVASRITRSPAARRYAWPQPAVLLRQP